jgi:hypothetical protein
VRLHFDTKKEMEEVKQHPAHYENQFDVASGNYVLKVVFSTGGEGFGKAEVPLQVDPYEMGQFGISGVALSQEGVSLKEADPNLDAALIEDRKTLVSQGLQFVPSGTNHFKKGKMSLLYLEVYEPLLVTAADTKVMVQLRIVDTKSGKQALDTGYMSVASRIQPGNAVVPVGMRLPIEQLAPGAYRAELRATDSAGRTSPLRNADFQVE